MRHRFPLAISPRVPLIATAVCLALLCISHTAPAETSREANPVETVGEPENPAKLPPLLQGPARPTTPTPMMQAILEVLESEKVAVAALEVRLANATGESEILSMMREIERIKRDTERSVLRIQVDFARAAGQSEKADRLDAMLNQMRRADEEREAARAARAEVKP